MTKLLLQAENLSFSVPKLTVKDQSLKSGAPNFIRRLYTGRSPRRENVDILKNLNFTLKTGERLGVIGQNGCGKTTLLRLICGIYKPSSGNLIVRGDAHGLFNVQLGMMQDATGVENIYLRGLQMGLGPREINERMELAVEFSGLEERINDFFSTYSAGMKLRLAVAISTMVNPDVLVMDEWIGAGDQEFKAKVNKRLESMIDSSKGLVIATHSDGLMRRLCTTGLVLTKGRVQMYGHIDEALDYYARNPQKFVS